MSIPQESITPFPEPRYDNDRRSHATLPFVVRRDVTRDRRLNDGFDSAIPIVESDVFLNKPEAEFWIGEVAIMGQIAMPAEYEAAQMLRANVYIDEMKFLPDYVRHENGTESDADDERSIHFAVIQNGKSINPDRLVGTTRLIIKQSESDLLPVEHLFPEAFENNPVPVGSSEASRFISRHPHESTQHLIALAEIRAMDIRAIEATSGVYAVIERPLAKLFKLIGLPFTQLSEYRTIPEYNTENTAVYFDPKEVMRSVGTDKFGRLGLAKFFQNALVDLGVGYYDDTFSEQIKS